MVDWNGGITAEQLRCPPSLSRNFAVSWKPSRQEAQRALSETIRPTVLPSRTATTPSWCASSITQGAQISIWAYESCIGRTPINSSAKTCVCLSVAADGIVRRCDIPLLSATFYPSIPNSAPTEGLHMWLGALHRSSNALSKWSRALKRCLNATGVRLWVRHVRGRQHHHPVLGLPLLSAAGGHPGLALRCASNAMKPHREGCRPASPGR